MKTNILAGLVMVVGLTFTSVGVLGAQEDESRSSNPEVVSFDSSDITWKFPTDLRNHSCSMETNIQNNTGQPVILATQIKDSTAQVLDAEGLPEDPDYPFTYLIDAEGSESELRLRFYDRADLNKITENETEPLSYRVYALDGTVIDTVVDRDSLANSPDRSGDEVCVIETAPPTTTTTAPPTTTTTAPPTTTTVPPTTTTTVTPPTTAPPSPPTTLVPIVDPPISIPDLEVFECPDGRIVLTSTDCDGGPTRTTIVNPPTTSQLIETEVAAPNKPVTNDLILDTNSVANDTPVLLALTGSGTVQVVAAGLFLMVSGYFLVRLRKFTV